MTDIVERLRETETDVYTPPELATECREAADEIERLRSEVESLRDLIRDIAELDWEFDTELQNALDRRINDALGE